MVETREGQIRIGVDVPRPREEIGYFLWAVQQSKVVGYFVVTPVDMLAVEVANIQTGVWERQDGLSVFS